MEKQKVLIIRVLKIIESFNIRRSIKVYIHVDEVYLDKERSCEEGKHIMMPYFTYFYVRKFYDQSQK